MWTLYNLQFSNNHHDIAVNVTLNLSLKEKKIYSKSKTTLQYSNKEKVPENPKRPQPFMLISTVLSLIYTASTQECELDTTRTRTRNTEVWLKWPMSEIVWTEMECAVRKHEQEIYFTWGLEAITSNWPNSTRGLQVRKFNGDAALCLLQISHADAKHTEYSYIALHEVQRE